MTDAAIMASERWECGACGEMNKGERSKCNNCGKARIDVRPHDDGGAAPRGDAASLVPDATRKRRRGWDDAEQTTKVAASAAKSSATVMERLVKNWTPNIEQLKAMSVAELQAQLKSWKVHIEPNAFTRDAMVAKALKVMHNIDECDSSLGSSGKEEYNPLAGDSVESTASMQPTTASAAPSGFTGVLPAAARSTGVSGVPVSERTRHFLCQYSANAVDEQARAALQMQPPEVQVAVMLRGPLTEASKPSSAIMSRIKDARAAQGLPPRAVASQAAAPGGVPAAANSECGVDAASDSVDRFILEYRLDQEIARRLRMEPVQVQQLVMSRGSLANCRNASSAVYGRIKDAQRTMMEQGGR